MGNEPAQRSSKPVAIWLFVGVAMIIIQILLGGITRLTGSGLSITEWDVITGTLPPMNRHEWLIEFEKYKQTPQFQFLNSDFTLRDFKFIFFWEWLHRFWARLIGVVFAVPFVIFLIQRRFKSTMIKPMLILFLLGALQGLVGWIMVASGLTGDSIYVKPTRLAIHFILALGLLSYTFWFAIQILIDKKDTIVNPGLRRFTWVILAFFVIQLVYGSLMAGYKTATVAPTWPDINDALIPSGLFRSSDTWVELFENKIAIQFIHRLLAYILFVLICIWTWKAFRIKEGQIFAASRWFPLFLITLQLMLGILAVTTSLKIVPNKWGIFEWMAQLHQMVAILLLLSLIWMLFIVKSKKRFM